MKKTATKILTATMALAMGISGVAPLVAPSNPAWAEEAKTDIILNDMESLSSYMRFEYIDPDYALRFVFNRKPLEFTLAYMNYTDGVTEAEADALLPILGTGKNEGFVTIAHDDRPSFGHTFAPTAPAKVEDNESEIIYYALRYGTKDANTGEVQGEYWVRGKVDYRRCYHSEAYHEGAYCRPLTDSVTGKLTFLPVATKTDTVSLAPEGEEVLSWEDEWRQIMQRRSETMLAIAQQFEREFPNLGQKLLEEFEGTVRQLEKSAYKISDTSIVLSRIPKILRSVAMARINYNNSIGQNQYASYQRLQNDYQALQDKLNNIDQDTSGLLEAIAQQEAEIARLTEEVEAQASELKQKDDALAEKDGRIAELEAQLEMLQELQSELEQLRQENRALQQKVTELEAALTEAENKVNQDDSHAESNLAELQAWQKKASELNTELQQVRQNLSETEAKLQAVQTVKTTLKGELEKMTKENTQTKQESSAEIAQIKQSSFEEIAQLKQENAKLTQEREKLSAENQKLSQEKQALQAKIKALEAELAGKTTGKVGEVRINNEAEDASAEVDAATEMENTEAAEAATEAGKQVEVPNLGEIETKTNWWWLAAGAMALLGTLGLWCKRHFGRR